MTHDPMCVERWFTPDDGVPCICDIIAKVRADTLDQATSGVEAIRGYDMSAAWYSEIGDDYAEGWVECVEAAVAKIDSLRGES